MMTLLGGVVGVELWQRRKLKRIVRQIAREGPLMHAAIRITNEVRGSVDIPRMLKVSTLEVAQILNIEHCCLLILDSNKQRESACSCESSNHEHDIEIAFAGAINSLQHEGCDRFIIHNYPNSADPVVGRTSFPVFGLPLTRDADGLGGVLLVLSTDSTRLWLDSEIQMLLAVAHQLSLSVSHDRVFAAKEQESLTDFLTGCLNRRGFNAQLKDHFPAATERNRSISLIMIDLDRFKAINDNYGHAVGDEVLRNLAGVLLEEAANGAIAARIGGEEFALILPYHSIEEAAEIAERVRQRAERITMPELACRVTISCGVASAFSSRSPDSLFAAADKSLYRAKTSGRNRVCLD